MNEFENRMQLFRQYLVVFHLFLLATLDIWTLKQWCFFMGEYILEIYNPNLIELTFEMTANVLICFQLLTLFIEIKKIKKNTTQYTSINAHSYITFVIHPTLMMVRGWTESTWEISNFARYINQFPSNIIGLIGQLEWIKNNMKTKMSTMFNQICINDEFLQYIYIYIYIYIYMYIYIYTRSVHMNMRESLMIKSRNHIN